MNLPFTTDDFLAVFTAYNAAIWPIQIAAYGFGLVAAAAVLVPRYELMRLAFAALAILWAVTGIGYHMMFFSSINPIAPAFAAFFVVQGILFTVSAMRPGDLRLRLGWDFRSIAGLSTMVYAAAVYPILGIWAGHGWMAGPMFGVAPCPTTIFTIGILMIARGRWVFLLSVIPVLWSLIGLAAALQLGIFEDLAMPVAGALLAGTQVLNLRKGRTPS
jgi:hypothetical protein